VAELADTGLVVGVDDSVEVFQGMGELVTQMLNFLIG